MKKELFLDEIVNRQLISLSKWANLPPSIVERTIFFFHLFCGKSLNRKSESPFEGLSYINASGLPFQWCFSFGVNSPSVRFLCEAGTPGDSPQRRLQFSLDLLAEAFKSTSISYPYWLWECFFNQVLPKKSEWPQYWKSALWFGVSASQNGLIIKPYVNLNRDTPLIRWQIIGRTLKSLQKFEALAKLCELSSKVSADSLPVGIAIDVLPDGSPGRLKIYFQSLSVKPDWLERWYTSLCAESVAPAIRQLLDYFPWCGNYTYLPKSFIISLEFHRDDGEVSLKTDLGLNRWIDNDFRIFQGICSLLNNISIDRSKIISALKTVCAWPLSTDVTQFFRFVGHGYEPDGSHHYNVYLEPPLKIKCKPIRINFSSKNQNLSSAVDKGLEYILSKLSNNKWTDYLLPVGKSDKWVSSYILYHLSEISMLSNRKDTFINSLEWLINSRSPNGGWGFNETTSDDADTTSFTILSLKKLNLPIPVKAIKFIKSCRTKNGGIATYPSNHIPGGTWTYGIPEITAVAMLALNGKASKIEQSTSFKFLVNQQLPNGSWPSFWWLTPLYATYYALCWLSDLGKIPRKSELIDFLLHYHPIGAFDTALLILCLTRLKLFNYCNPFVVQLLKTQQENGSWKSSAFMRLTKNTVSEPWKVIDSGPVYVDQNSLFTTATVVSALNTTRNKL